MKFWEKFWKLVSKKDLVFGALIILIAVIIPLVQSTNNVKVTFGENAVDIVARRYTMNVPYEMVESIELADLLDGGENLNGRDDMVTRTGTWKNH